MDFIQQQILGMAWLQSLINLGLHGLGLPMDNRWVQSLSYFVFDVVKIGLLLCILIFIISYIQSFFPPERSRRKSWGGSAGCLPIWSPRFWAR